MTIEAGAIVEAFGGAAIGMRSWDSALSLVAEATRARIGQIAVLDRGNLRFNLLTGTSPDEEAAYFAARGLDPAVNLRTRAIVGAPPLVGITESDFATPDTLDRSDIYQGLFRECDVPFSLQVRDETAESMTIALCLQRPGTSGLATADEKRLVELLIRGVGSAVDASLALGRTLDQETLTTAEHLTAPAVLLGADMQVVSLSLAAETLLRQSLLLTIRGNRIIASDDRGRIALDRAFRAATLGPLALRRTHRVVLSGRGGEVLPIDICPMPMRMSGPLSSARALLAFRVASQADGARTRAAVEQAFGLTPAEAEIALALADGLNVNEVAARRASSVNTVRAQIKAIFAKTGWRRQTELALTVRAITDAR